MSGAEVVGLVLGVFPLAVSAMEHYEVTKKAAGTFWMIRKAYRKDVRNVTFCQTMFSLHVEELLQPLSQIEIEGDANKCAELLKEPGGKLWKSDEVEQALAARLRNCHQPYMNTMAELQDCMIKLAKETKFEDAQFQGLLVKQAATTPQTQLMQQANMTIRDAAFQARRLKYSLTSSSREKLLQDVETYIRRLQDLLAAVDRVCKTAQEPLAIRTPSISKTLLNFWRHAERIYRLMRRSMSCTCRSKHGARLWLCHNTEAKANLRLILCFAKSSQAQAGSSQVDHLPWSEEPLRVDHVEVPTICSPSAMPSTAMPSVVVQNASINQMNSQGRGRGTRTITRTARVSFAANPGPAAPIPNLMTEGMCKALAQRCQRAACLGSLVDENEDVHYHVFPEKQSTNGPVDVVTAHDLLKADSRLSPSFYQSYRHGVALKLAVAQLQYHSTPWFRGIWTLEDIWFSKRAVEGLDYSNPYVLADFEAGAPGKTRAPVKDQSFFTLGVVLLELCFGKQLEQHAAFADPAFSRNSKDPFQRQAVAYQWAEDVVLEADEDYARAVKWCLQQAPVSVPNEDWRKDFAHNVLQPLQRCCEPTK